MTTRTFFAPFFAAAFSVCLGTQMIAVAAAQGQAAPAQTPPAARTADDDTISPERPGFTNGTDTVAPGHIQLEVGYLYQNTRDGWENRYLDTSQVRLPLGARTEFRIGLPAYSSTHSNGSSVTGFEDSSVSVKWRFLDAAPHRPSFALIAGTTLPTGASALREKTLQPQADLEADYPLSPLWTLEANAIYTRASDSGQRFDEYAGALNLNYQVNPQNSVFVETYRIAPTGAGGAPNGNYADGGLAHLVGRNMQLDLSAGVGVSSGVRGDYFLEPESHGAGKSHRHVMYRRLLDRCRRILPGNNFIVASRRGKEGRRIVR